MFRVEAYSSSSRDESGCIKTASIPLVSRSPVMMFLLITIATDMQNFLSPKIFEGKKEVSKSSS